MSGAKRDDDVIRRLNAPGGAAAYMTIATERGSIEAWIDVDAGAAWAFARFETDADGNDVPDLTGWVRTETPCAIPQTWYRRVGSVWARAPEAPTQLDDLQQDDLRRAINAAFVMVGL